MSATEISDTSSRMGRPKLNFDATPGRFPAGTFARIAAVLRDGEDRTAFIRKAVQAELERREKAKD